MCCRCVHIECRPMALTRLCGRLCVAAPWQRLPGPLLQRRRPQRCQPRPLWRACAAARASPSPATRAALRRRSPRAARRATHQQTRRAYKEAYQHGAQDEDERPRPDDADEHAPPVEIVLRGEGAPARVRRGVEPLRRIHRADCGRGQRRRQAAARAALGARTRTYGAKEPRLRLVAARGGCGRRRDSDVERKHAPKPRLVLRPRRGARACGGRVARQSASW